VPVNRHQSRRALAVNSGPLSQWMNRGARPCSATTRSSTPTVASASSLRSTVMARASRGVLIDHVEQLQDPAVGGLVELVVQRPHVVRVLGGQPIRRTGRGAEPLAFAPPDRDAQAFLAPQPLDGLAVHPPALLAELGVGAAIAPAGMSSAEPAQLAS
jgi:hypothetical protein